MFISSVYLQNDDAHIMVNSYSELYQTIKNEFLKPIAQDIAIISSQDKTSMANESHVETAVNKWWRESHERPPPSLGDVLRKMKQTAVDLSNRRLVKTHPQRKTVLRRMEDAYNNCYEYESE